MLISVVVVCYRGVARVALKGGCGALSSGPAVEGRNRGWNSVSSRQQSIFLRGKGRGRNKVLKCSLKVNLSLLTALYKSSTNVAVPSVFFFSPTIFFIFVLGNYSCEFIYYLCVVPRG
jgi:hypothetical protein